MRARDHVVEWLEKLDPRLDDGDPEIRREYLNLTATLAALAPQLKPEVIAPLLTQRELADRLSVSTRTIRRRVKRGELPAKLRLRGVKATR
jgi:excisionase family DNA binding protein